MTPLSPRSDFAVVAVGIAARALNRPTKNVAGRYDGEVDGGTLMQTIHGRSSVYVVYRHDVIFFAAWLTLKVMARRLSTSIVGDYTYVSYVVLSRKRIIKRGENGRGGADTYATNQRFSVRILMRLL